jgi:betaine-aldehyde dehydrogenase
MLREGAAVPYGPTCSIRSNDVSTAYHTALVAEAGLVWINKEGKHFLGAPFGGVTQSGFGRGERPGELVYFTVEKNIRLRPAKGKRQRRAGLS